MVVDVAKSGISWTEPRDLSLDTLGTAAGKSPRLILSSNHSAGVNIAMADGSLRCLQTGNYSTADLRSILQIGGCAEQEIGSHEMLYLEPLGWPNIAALAVWLFSVGTLLTKAVRSRKTLPSSPAG